MDLTNKKILILAPHPDDELISSFSIIENAKSCKNTIKVIFVTSGERNYLANIKVYKSFKLNPQHYAFIRENEARLVMEKLGVNDFEFWRFPDLGISKKKQELLNKLKETIKEFKPDVLISPSVFDLHKDHNSIGMVISSLSDQFQKLKIFYYIVHHDNLLGFLTPDFRHKLSKDAQEKKRRFFNYYKSQILYNKSFFLRHLDEEVFFSKDISNSVPLPLEIDFIGKDFVWIKVKYRNFFLNPLKLNISATYQDDNIYDFTVTIKWNRSIIPLPLKNSKTYSYIKIQRLIGEEGGYITIPLSCFKDSKELFIKLSNLNPVFDITGYINIKTMKDIQRSKKPNVCVVIPCFNIAKLCVNTVEKSLAYADNVIVVNDGSTDNTKESLEEIVKQHDKLHVLHLSRNMGKGNALLKGITYALQNIDFDLLITMDGDMQHRPEDIPLFKEAWQNGADMILGVRSWDKDVPLRSKIGNVFINKLCEFLLKNKISDSQTGFRGFDITLLQKIIDSECIKAGRYETELDIFLYSYLSGARVSEVEIPTIYLDGNASSH